MIVLDTTVLLYAVGGEHPLRQPCRRVLEAHAAETVEAATTVEVLQEFAHVHARRRTRSDALALANTLAASLTIVESSRADLEQGLLLWERHTGLGAFDAVLAAVAIDRHAEALVSADRGFRGIRGLTLLEPNSPRLGRLIAP